MPSRAGPEHRSSSHPPRPASRFTPFVKLCPVPSAVDRGADRGLPQPRERNASIVNSQAVPGAPHLRIVYIYPPSSGGRCTRSAQRPMLAPANARFIPVRRLRLSAGRRARRVVAINEMRARAPRGYRINRTVPIHRGNRGILRPGRRLSRSHGACDTRRAGRSGEHQCRSAWLGPGGGHVVAGDAEQVQDGVQVGDAHRGVSRVAHHGLGVERDAESGGGDHVKVVGAVADRHRLG